MSDLEKTMRKSPFKTITTKEVLDKDGFYHEFNDCVVEALSVALGLPYRMVHGILRRAGRQDRKGTTMRIYGPILERQGFKMTEFWSHPNCRYSHPTLKQLWPRFQKGTHVIRQPGHLFVVKDGVVFNYKPVGSRIRISNAWSKVD